MRILYCNKYNFPFSGTESYLFEAMELVRAHGHAAALFSMADPRGEPTPYDRHFVPPVDFKNGGSGPIAAAKLAGRTLYSREARRKLRGMIAEFRPDVAHVRNIYHHLSPSILWELKAQGVPVLYHVNDFKLLCPSYNLVSHGSACERCQGGKFWHVMAEGCYEGRRGSSVLLAAEAYLHKWMDTYGKCVDCFLAPSQFVRQKLIDNGWPSGKIEVLSHFPARFPRRSPLRNQRAGSLLRPPVSGKRSRRSACRPAADSARPLADRRRWEPARRPRIVIRIPRIAECGVPRPLEWSAPERRHRLFAVHRAALSRLRNLWQKHPRVLCARTHGHRL